MKRIIPHEIRQMQAWLLANARYQDYDILTNIISCMESGIKLNDTYSQIFESLLAEYKATLPADKPQDSMQTRLYRYFLNKYGSIKARAIVAKLGIGVEQYSYEELIVMGKKIALFNDWREIR